MTRKEFDELTHGKSVKELDRILSRYCNDLVDLNKRQVEKIFKLKEKIEKEERRSYEQKHR